MTIWGTATGGLFTCPHCGARYAVRHFHTPQAKRGVAICAACDRQMSEWNSVEQPSYTLIERPQQNNLIRTASSE
jgi:uncharacterized protein (DUF983 family)